MAQPSEVIDRALELLSSCVNLKTGLTHSNDRKAARELFSLLRQSGEKLEFDEVLALAEFNGWLPKDAQELASLAEIIASAKRPPVIKASYWKANIIEQLQRPLPTYESSLPPASRPTVSPPTTSPPVACSQGAPPPEAKHKGAEPTGSEFEAAASKGVGRTASASPSLANATSPVKSIAALDTPLRQSQNASRRAGSPHSEHRRMFFGPAASTQPGRPGVALGPSRPGAGVRSGAVGNPTPLDPAKEGPMSYCHDVYSQLIRLAKPSRLAPEISPQPRLDAFEGFEDPADVLDELLAKYQADVLKAAGVVSPAEGGTLRLHPELVGADKTWLAVRCEQGYIYSLATETGCLNSGVSGTMLHLADHRVRMALVRNGRLLVAPTLLDVAVLRAVGLAAVTYRMLDQIRLPELQALLAFVGQQSSQEDAWSGSCASSEGLASQLPSQQRLTSAFPGRPQSLPAEAASRGRQDEEVQTADSHDQQAEQRRFAIATASAPGGLSAPELTAPQNPQSPAARRDVTGKPLSPAPSARNSTGRRVAHDQVSTQSIAPRGHETDLSLVSIPQIELRLPEQECFALLDEAGLDEDPSGGDFTDEFFHSPTEKVGPAGHYFSNWLVILGFSPAVFATGEAPACEAPACEAPGGAALVAHLLRFVTYLGLRPEGIALWAASAETCDGLATCFKYGTSRSVRDYFLKNAETKSRPLMKASPKPVTPLPQAAQRYNELLGNPDVQEGTLAIARQNLRQSLQASLVQPLIEEAAGEQDLARRVRLTQAAFWLSDLLKRNLDRSERQARQSGMRPSTAEDLKHDELLRSIDYKLYERVITALKDDKCPPTTHKQHPTHKQHIESWGQRLRRLSGSA